MKKKDVGWDERESECEYLACKRLDEISSYNLGPPLFLHL